MIDTAFGEHIIDFLREHTHESLMVVKASIIAPLIYHANEFKNKFITARSTREKDYGALPVQPFLRVLNLVKAKPASPSDTTPEITAEQVLTEIRADLAEITCEDILKKWE